VPEGAGPAATLRAAIITALYDISAYELEDVCTGLGLRPPDEGERAFSSKRLYVIHEGAGDVKGRLVCFSFAAE
jgi:hypothetical protein